MPATAPTIATAREPLLLLMATLQASDALALGGRVTWFSYGSLNPAFFTRQAAFGNVAGTGAAGRS